MRIAIYSNSSRDINYEIAIKTASLILKYNAVPVFEPEVQEDIKKFDCPEGIVFDNFDTCRLLITIGGDGTLLAAVSKYRDLDIPFIGINKGSIGFLTEISEDRLEEAISRICRNEYELINRFQLKCDVINSEGQIVYSDIALNDTIVTRGHSLHIVKMDLKVDDQLVERFYGDGLLISTPTGSTAYSLAAGGPILMPRMKNMIITPILSHTLQNACYILDSKSTIEIDLQDMESMPILSVDGKESWQLNRNDTVRIKACDRFCKFASLGFTGFFDNLRTKLIQRGAFYENGEK